MFFFGPCLSLDIPGPVTRFSQVDLLLTEEVRKEEKIARCRPMAPEMAMWKSDEETLIFCCGIY
jgi:hypothetical protein